MRFRVPGTLVIAAIALGAIAVWPAYSAHQVAASVPTPAPVLADYLMRDKTISFYEARVRNDRQDQISARLLASQYLQRYRETGDVGDILRAKSQAERALKLQPQNNAAADETIASADTALHRFTGALAYERAASVERPDDTNALAQAASLQMELGRYADASRTLAKLSGMPATPTVLSVRARYDELTGRLDDARRLLAHATAQTDSVMDNPAQSRAWFHFRSGELAFSAGDVDAAKQDERDALAIFPTFEQASRALARFCWATRDWRCALDAARTAANVTPLPESLGYEADAQRALGDESGARATQGLIVAIERIGNAYRLSDRLLAVYYTHTGMRLPQAYAIAQREVQVRGNEIYAQDTLAWAAASLGKWDVAREAAALANRYGTQDSRILYHAGVIGQHFGDMTQARRSFEAALQLNPTFDPIYADDARRRLAAIAEQSRS